MAERAEGGGKSPERCMLQPGLHSEPLLGSGGPGLLRAWLLDSLLSENRGGPDSREKPVGGHSVLGAGSPTGQCLDLA